MTAPQAPPLWTSADLRSATGATLTADVTVQGVSIDTRTLAPGDLFIALHGEHSDGHAHVQAALDAGAACVMVHDRCGRDDPRLLVVENTMQGLVALGRFARARFKGRIVAVTGSVGKTTTKNMLRTALAALGETHAAMASFNNHWGVPLTLARLPQNARFCVSEIGMNHVGEILPLARQVQPDVALITTIGTAHIGNMGSITAIAREKASLFAALNADGTAIVPDTAPEQALLRDAVPPGRHFLRSGTDAGADLRLENLSCHADGSTFALHIAPKTGPDTGLDRGPERKPVPVKLTAPGRHLAQNAALVLGAIGALGEDVTRAAHALESFVPDVGRGAKRLLRDNVTLLDESYNASSASLRATLEALSLLPATRRIVALGDILELGDFAESEHRSLADAVIAAGAITFCCGLHMRTLFAALPSSLQGAYAPDAQQLASRLRAFLRPGDVLLVKGSHGSRMRDLVAALDQPSETVFASCSSI